MHDFQYFIYEIRYMQSELSKIECMVVVVLDKINSAICNLRNLDDDFSRSAIRSLNLAEAELEEFIKVWSYGYRTSGNSLQESISN